MVYREMAALYDQFMEHVTYDKWVMFTKEVIKQRNKHVQAVVDLGCGTGNISICLAKEGYSVIGIDSSSDMLTLAEQKASNCKLSIQWILNDIRKLDGLKDIDLAISYCDVINYITDKNDLKETFERVNRILKQGGIFIFDVHDIEFIEQHYINHTFADAMDDSAYIWYCSGGKTRGEMYHELTFFHKRNTYYDRFDEVHHQKTYPLQVYKQLLMQSGFIKIAHSYDFTTKNKIKNSKGERIFIIAEKGSE